MTFIRKKSWDGSKSIVLFLSECNLKLYVKRHVTLNFQVDKNTVKLLIFCDRLFLKYSTNKSCQLFQVRMQNQVGSALYKNTVDCTVKTVKNEVGNSG